MDEKLVSIKEYADLQGITQQAVYQQLKRKSNKQLLKGHVVQKNGKKYLDEFAVQHLTQQRKTTPSIIIEDSTKAELEELKQELEAVKEERDSLKNALMEELKAHNEDIKQLSERILLLTTTPEETPDKEKRGFWSKLFK